MISRILQEMAAGNSTTSRLSLVTQPSLSLRPFVKYLTQPRHISSS